MTTQTKDKSVKISVEDSSLSDIVMLSKQLDSTFNRQVGLISSQEEKIEHELRNFKNTVDEYVIQYKSWIKSLAVLEQTIKEIGDFENWTAVINHDLAIILDTFKSIEKL